ncbi:purine nucleoside phosphoramidase [Escherichia coli]|uniref:Purine nucleoside phosphoramidase n=1 Tax=Escherichia coli TaxID=562 RepID=A0A376DH86_ECOLX|nr:purine nucleoside phosphoramidase [Escherichia coli]
MAEETIFSKIIRREIPSDIVYQDDLVTAFRDISPQAPTHILIIPNILIPTVNDVSAEHEQALGRMITVAAKIAEQEGIAEDGLSSDHEHQPPWRTRGLPHPYAFVGWLSAGTNAGA